MRISIVVLLLPLLVAGCGRDQRSDDLSVCVPTGWRLNLATGQRSSKVWTVQSASETRVVFIRAAALPDHVAAASALARKAASDLPITGYDGPLERPMFSGLQATSVPFMSATDPFGQRHAFARVTAALSGDQLYVALELVKEFSAVESAGGGKYENSEMYTRGIVSSASFKSIRSDRKPSGCAEFDRIFSGVTSPGLGEVFTGWVRSLTR